MTLRDYVFIVARNWIVVAVTMAIGLVTALVLAVTSPSTYTTSAQVLFTGHAPTSGQDLAYVGSYVQNRMQTYSNLEQSTSLLTSVTAALGTDESPGELGDRVEIDVSQLDTVATVHATDSTAEGAARTANALAGAFLDAVQRLEADDATGCVRIGPIQRHGAGCHYGQGRASQGRHRIRTCRSTCSPACSRVSSSAAVSSRSGRC